MVKKGRMKPKSPPNPDPVSYTHLDVYKRQIKDLAYSGSGYCIVVPTKPEELAEERCV